MNTQREIILDGSDVYAFFKMVDYDNSILPGDRLPHRLSVSYRSSYNVATNVLVVDCFVNEANALRVWKCPGSWTRMDTAFGTYRSPRKLMTVDSIYWAMLEVVKSVDEVKALLLSQGYEQTYPKV